MIDSTKGSRLVTFVMSLMASVFVLSGSQSLGQQDEATQELTGVQLMQAMSLTSKAFRAAADEVRPAMVTIESFGGVSTVQGRIGGIRAQGEGNTTGVMISPDGYILTSTFNFIQQPPVISVITSDGKRRIAKLLGRDDTRKITLLKIDDVSDMPVARVAPLKEVEIGQWVVSLGVGYGDTQPALSVGILSATNRIGGKAIQTDANISPANYGGPLVDIEGRVLGICVPMNPQSQAVGAGVEWYDSGIGFAVPLDGADEIIERLKKGENIRPGFVGVVAIANPRGKGLFIERVVQNSPAGDEGLLRGDVILEVNGQAVDEMLTFKSILNRFESGLEIDLKVKQADKQEPTEMSLKLADPPRPKGALEPMEPPKIR